MINKNALWDAETLGIYKPYKEEKEESDKALAIFGIVASVVLTICFLVILRDLVLHKDILLSVITN